VIVVYQNIKAVRMLGFTFCQALSQRGFALHVWSLFSHFCQSVPCLHKSSSLGYKCKLGNRARKGQTLFSLTFATRAYPVFTSLYNLFYVNGRKTIPSSIGELLTPLGLAMSVICERLQSQRRFLSFYKFLQPRRG